MIILLLITIFFHNNVYATVDFDVEKISEIPNICQTCYPKLVRWGGEPHCAPASVSNSIFWLSKNGFPNLLPFVDLDQNVAQAKLLNLLGDTMGTTDTEGTSPYKVMNGLKKYLDSKNVVYKKMAATGWRDVPSFVERKTEWPSLSWVQQGIKTAHSVWILVLWTRYNEKKDRYEIFGGHWVTIVGFGKNESGLTDKNILVIHDPAPRAQRRNYFSTATILSHGIVYEEDRSTISPKDAKGAISLSGDFVFKPTASHGIVVGAYYLVL